MKPIIAQRVLLSVGLALNLLFGMVIYLNEHGPPLWTTGILQLARIVVLLMASIIGFSGKKKLTFALIHFGSFLVGIVLNFVIGFNFLASIYRGLFNVWSWIYLDQRTLMANTIITLIVNAFFCAGTNAHGEVRSLRGDPESLAGLLPEFLITQDDYDRKKEEILRRH